MARIYLDRLKKYYPDDTVTGKKYKELIEMIMLENSQKLNNRIYKLTDKQYSKQNNKITKKEKRFRLPDLGEILPNKTISVRKSAEKGNLITDDLRDKLSQRLKETLKQKGLERQRGPLTGTLKKEVIDDFEKAIKKTFVNYTKRDPKFGVPGNVRNIATTELRSAISEIKAEYNQKILEKNPDTEMIKKWIHNMGLLKNPLNARDSHVVLHGVMIPYSEMFKIDDEDGVFLTLYPHHKSLPASQVIGCQCEVQYIVRKK